MNIELLYYKHLNFVNNVILRVNSIENELHKLLFLKLVSLFNICFSSCHVPQCFLEGEFYLK